MDIIIDGRCIGKESNVFLVAEVGVNHNGDIKIAEKLIDLAAEAKVDAIKFQTFITENLLLSTTPKAEYQKSSTIKDENFYESVKKYELNKEDFKHLKDYCSQKGLIFLSTPFDEISVEWLEDLNVSAYKVGSGDMNNFPLLELICSKHKPILLSTGMANLEEVKESVKFIKERKIDDLVIFQCTTNYPSRYEDINLNVIDTYREEFPDILIGFSDHSQGIEASLGAVVKGARVIEKHFTLDKNMEGPDHLASLSPEELILWVQGIRNLEKALGSAVKNPTKEELEIAKIARKSVVTINDIQKGNIIELKDLAIKRTETGIEPKNIDHVIGKKAKNHISKDSIIKFEDLE